MADTFYRMLWHVRRTRGSAVLPEAVGVTVQRRDVACRSRDFH